MKQSTKRIGLIILIVVLTIIECLLCHGIALEGNYLVDLPLDHPGIKVIYRDVTILEIFMFVNLGVAIIALCLLWRKNNDKDKSPVHKPAQNGFCKVCGYQLNYLPWGEDGKTPCFDICPCCGVEFGNEDYTEESLKEYRAKWINEGAHWFDPKLQPQNWSLQEQISNISLHSEDSCIEK